MLREAGKAVLEGSFKELLRNSLPSFLGQDPPLGNRQLSGVTALVILGGVAGTELLPLQVERIEGEGGGRGEGREKRGTDAQTDGPGGQLSRTNEFPSLALRQVRK